MNAQVNKASPVRSYTEKGTYNLTIKVIHYAIEYKVISYLSENPSVQSDAKEEAYRKINDIDIQLTTSISH